MVSITNPTIGSKDWGNTVNTFFDDLVSEVIDKSTIDAKGDLLVGTADNAISKLTVGATNGHVLTVDSGETTGLKWAAGGGDPNVDNWGQTTKTISADEPLTDASTTLQWLNPEGGDYDVNLPTADTDSPFFEIYNDGLEGTLTIVDPEGGDLLTLSANEAGLVRTNGSKWIARKVTNVVQRASEVTICNFGGDHSTTDTAYRAQGAFSAGSLAFPDNEVRYAVPKACTSARVSWIAQSTVTTTANGFQIRKNGGSDELLGALSITANTPGHYDLSAASYAAGDDAGIGYTSGSEPNDSQWIVSFDRTVDGGYRYRWGGDHTSGTNLFDTNAAAAQTGLVSSFNDANQHTVLEAFTSGALTYDCESNDATTEFRIHKNLGNDEDVPLTANKHDAVTTSGVTFAADDEVSVSYLTGTQPGETTVQLEAGHLNGVAYGFGGDTTSQLKLLYGWGVHDISAPWTSHDYRTALPIVSAGTTRRWSHNHETATALNPNIWKNGGADESLTTAASTHDTGALSGTTYLVDDSLSTDPNHASAADMTFLILID